jgi:DnaK suppressor protein
MSDATKDTIELSPLAIAGLKPYEVKPGEEYMNDKQKNHFRKILTAWRDQLMKDSSSTVDHMNDETTNFPDDIDRAAQEEEFSLELRIRDRERKLIKKIEKTIRKLDSDDYGYCDD